MSLLHKLRDTLLAMKYQLEEQVTLRKENVFQTFLHQGTSTSPKNFLVSAMYLVQIEYIVEDAPPQAKTLGTNKDLYSREDTPPQAKTSCTNKELYSLETKY